MGLLGSTRRKPGWLCINLMRDRVDLSHIQITNTSKPQVTLCDSYRQEGDAVATLKRLRRELKLSTYRCTTLLRAGEYQMVQAEAPNVPPAELKAAMRWRVKELIDFPVESATVDALQIPAADSGRAQQAFAVVARNEHISALMNPFIDAGISLEVIDVPELAQRNVAHCFEEPGRALALLSFDETGGLLTFTADGELYQYRRIDVTASRLAEANTEQRAQFYDRIVLELQRSLDHFDRQFHHLAISAVLVTPVPGADDLIEFLATNLGIGVRPVNLADAMDFDGVPELREPSHQSACLQLLGAALRTENAA
jgi:MSHA biogenesis protein MshI